jgi:outer membrane lipoprotein-sorting protein
MMKLKKQAVLFLLCLGLIMMTAQTGVAGEEDSAVPAPGLKEALARVEGKISDLQTVQTSFVQEKELAAFNQKIVLKGTLCLQKPSLLAWRVFEPARYSIVIDGSMVRQWDEDSNQVQEVSLAKNPTFQTAIGQMKQWFSGAYSALLTDYAITIHNQDPLALEFIPHATALAAQVVKHVTVVFREDERYIQEIRIEEQSGDRMLLRFVNTHLNESIDPAAWEVKPHVR